MKRAILFGVAALAWAQGAARASGPGISGEDLFKWGEYDSLIRILEPAALHPGPTGDHGDSLAQAKSLLFLGVAFCATGKPERADEAFSRAVEIDPDVELDRFYVTEEIARRFQTTALRALRKHPVRPVAAATSVPLEASRPSAPAASAGGRRHGWVWLGVGTTFTVAAVAAGYYLFSDHGGNGNKEEITRIDLSHP
jgi:tetratricopeptide (TPR) repeat protein